MKQNFLVGMYVTDDNYGGYTLKMDNLSPVKIKEIDKNDPLYKNIAFKNSWSHYQIITYDNTKNSNVTLLYSDLKNNKTIITFVKE